MTLLWFCDSYDAETGTQQTWKYESLEELLIDVQEYTEEYRSGGTILVNRYYIYDDETYMSWDVKQKYWGEKTCYVNHVKNIL